MITLLPDLPPDVSENILQSLDCKDTCNLAHSCKAFWALTCQQQSIEFRAGSDLSILSKAKSLSKYLYNRRARGLQVQHLSITLDGTHSVPLNMVVAEVIRSCSRSLRQLSLHNIVLECFSPPAGPFLDVVFLQDVVPELPQLKALQVMPYTMEAEAKNFECGFVHTDGAVQEPGLQLLAMQRSRLPLPASLRYIFLKNRHFVTRELEPGLGQFACLEELYITDLMAGQYKILLQHCLPAIQHSLRALLLDFMYGQTAHEYAALDLDLPRLQFLAMPNMHPFITGGTQNGPAVHLRCLQLAVSACQIAFPRDELCLKHLVTEGAPHLQTLQVVFLVDDISLGLYGTMWEALKGAHCLENLHVVLRGVHISDIDEQVKEMLKAALEVQGLCLPKLSIFNIDLRCIRVPRYMQDAVPGFLVGVPFQGAFAVSVAVRDLVARGVMPALTQVGLHPCKRGKSSARLHGQLAKFYGPLPHMVSLPHVKWVAMSQPGYMLEHPSWTGPDQDMLQRASVAMSQCRSLDQTLGKWNYARTMPAHNAAIDYTVNDDIDEDMALGEFLFGHHPYEDDLGLLADDIMYDHHMDVYAEAEVPYDDDVYDAPADVIFLAGCLWQCFACDAPSQPEIEEESILANTFGMLAENRLKQISS